MSSIFLLHAKQRSETVLMKKRGHNSKILGTAIHWADLSLAPRMPDSHSAQRAREDGAGGAIRHKTDTL